MSLRFKRVTESDAQLLLTWRSDPELSKHLFTDLKNTTVEQQKLWIRSLAQRKDYRAYMIQDGDKPIGFLTFSEIDEVNKRCSPGLYIYDKAAGLKYAITLHYYISAYVFQRLKSNKLMTQVLASNEKAQKIQKLKKNRLVGCLKQHIFKNNTFHDVYLYEALREDWERETKIVSEEIIHNAFDDWGTE
jgi:UDP-4-amino-4,6-dideoxy-N-acetyl-beta-L-altrosamine N-acetyltransferase